MSTTTSDIAAGRRTRVTPEMQAAWVKFDPVVPNTPPSKMRDAVLLQQGFYGGWLAATSTGDWRPMDTAPKDGTTIDVWRDGSRETVYWGFRPHECGEMVQYCDSDWHSETKPGWVCSTFGEFVGGKHDPFTHWMPLPSAPSQIEEG